MEAPPEESVQILELLRAVSFIVVDGQIRVGLHRHEAVNTKHLAHNAENDLASYDFRLVSTGGARRVLAFVDVRATPPVVGGFKAVVTVADRRIVNNQAHSVDRVAVVVALALVHLLGTIVSSVSSVAVACIAVLAVNARPAIKARGGQALVYVNVAVLAGKSAGTEAKVGVDILDALGLVVAGGGSALVNVCRARRVVVDVGVSASAGAHE
jgi:hypothetical protein